MINVAKKLVSKTETVIEKILQSFFIRSLVDRQNKFCSRSIYFPEGDNYWPSVAKYIHSIAENNENSFFRDPVVVLHLASNDIGLGYRIIDSIKSHPLGKKLLSSCNTPSWGSPYLLRKYPYYSPTTTTHIANIISIVSSFGASFESIIDFGGGYGGFSRCLAQYNNSVSIHIVDHEPMLKVQSKYINSTLSAHNCFFHSDVSQLTLSEYSIFNASFSYSELPLESRSKVEELIFSKCKGIHIIFQSRFYEIDNIAYMQSLKNRLESKGWKISINKYSWYGWEEAFLLIGYSKNF